MTKANIQPRPSAKAPEGGARRVYVRSYGCQMNEYDADRMVDVANSEGYERTDDPADADLIILNTCHIREKASEKVFSELGKLRQLKHERAGAGQETMIAVAGCVAQAEGDEILRRQPAVDLVVGPQNYHRLPELLRAAEAGRRVVDTDYPLEEKFGFLPAPAKARVAARGPSAFLTVQEGCDKFCAFCVVPYTRGAESSRPVADVLGELAQLVDAGVSEITLIGQNVNAYHGVASGRSWSLADLIARVAETPQVARIRYTTSHPLDMGDDLIQAHRDVPKLMPYLHLPVQSGSDRILRAMNRKHDAAAYLELVARIRQARPDIAFSSDFIVGFPGETEEDFRDTLALVEHVRFASAFSFKYSARPGTPAAGADDLIPEPVKARRLAELQALLDEQRRAFNTATVGRRLEVLFEKSGRHPGQIVGKSPYLQPVYASGSETLIGRVADVDIVSVGSNSLEGRLIGTPSST